MVSRSEQEFENYLMKEKIKKFKEIVLKASKALKLPKPPKIKIWDGECPHGKPNELAHIHPDKEIICISTRRLKQMNMEDVEEAATHEVSHMLDISHDYSFKKIHGKVKLKTWKPPQGIVIENGNIKNEKIVKGRSKTDRTRCNYHLCRKKTKLKKCPYCGGYFCKKHFSPKLPLTREMVDRERSPILARLYEEEWGKKSGHPDAVYSGYKLNEIAKKEKELTDRIMKALDKMKEIEAAKYPKRSGVNVFSRIPRSVFLKSKPRKIEEYPIDKKLLRKMKKDIKQDRDFELLERKTTRKIPVKSIVAIIMLIIILYVFFVYNEEIMKFLPIGSIVSEECIANYTIAYETTASFGKDPYTYCKDTCIEEYNSTIYNVIEPNETSKLTVCFCDVNNCNKS